MNGRLTRWRARCAGILLLACLGAAGVSAAAAPNAPNWRDYDVAAFETAQREHKFILLDLVAVWCHWCHVMDQQTYRDPAVLALIKSHFVPVKADHDARPDLAERYRDWGWPATIVLAPDGTEIVKRAGYIAPEPMARLLQAIVDDPSPEAGQLGVLTDLSASPELSAEVGAALRRRHVEAYDTVRGGLNIAQKFIDADSIDYALQRAAAGDAREAQRLRQTLDAGLKLIDPAFGGAYQYSTHFDWDHPHYEKIMRTQWAYLRSYSRACAQLSEPRYCDAAVAVADYLNTFLSAPGGAFYSSQDADLRQGEKGHAYFALDREARLALGLPRVDTHRYAAANGMAIEGLVALYEATGDAAYRYRALAAAWWAAANRSLWSGGFRHDNVDHAGPYLADTLWMGRAFAALYRATGDRDFLRRAQRAAEFMAAHFRHDAGGLRSAVSNGTPVEPLPQIDQNIQSVRFLLALNAIAPNPQWVDLAATGLRFLVTPEVALSRASDPGILMAAEAYRAAVAQPQSAGR